MADESTTTEEAPVEESTTSEQQPETDALGDGGKKALEAERSRAKDAEKRAKAAERALEAERSKGLSEAEKAIADAKAAGAAEATLNAGKRLAKAEIRAAAASKGLKVTDDDLDDLDLSKFVGEDGEPDPAAIATRIKRWEALAPDLKRPSGSADQGNRGAPAASTPRDEFAHFLQNQISRSQ